MKTSKYSAPPRWRRPFVFWTLRFVGLDDTGLIWGDYWLERFIPTTTLEVLSLRNRYRTAGIGAPIP